ncbi:MAG: aminoglycoside phosphotransferase [Rhodospirillales bacterium]|nr:aminoglycoside phosphotransferase [Rhodospirillales bacterium]
MSIISDDPAFGLGRLESYLRANIDGFFGAFEIEALTGGQSNPTFVIKLDGVKRYVLRKKPAGVLLPSAHAVDREYRVITALSDTDVPVPRTLCLCEDISVIGTMFFVMEFADGRSLWDPALPAMVATERAALYVEMNRVIAALHRVDYRAVGLESFGKPGNYFARQIARWIKQYRASETRLIPSMENLIAWLPENIPPGDETSLVHGDFRLDNMIFHATEPRVIAVLDWELSTLGHPLADFAYHVMAWRLRPDEYRGLAGVDIAGLGIPNERDYVTAYCKRTGRQSIEPIHWDFYLAYNMFRLASIRQGIMRRVIDGNASNPNAADVGRRAGDMADTAWRLVEKMKTEQET